MSATSAPTAFIPCKAWRCSPDFGDRLTAEAADDLSLVLDGPFAGALAGEDNLVLKAARALAERADRPAQAKLTLTKNLPVASGIGGGSADAAAALRALASLWQLSLEENVLREIAAELGSDIPVCLASRPAFMEGRGEILTPLGIAAAVCRCLLVNPGAAVPTKDVFAALGERRGVGMKLPHSRVQRSCGPVAVSGNHRQ